MSAAPEATASELPVQPPLQCASGDQPAWDEETDVLVVGQGAAGSAVALEAQAEGSEVLVVDRFGNGGATALSGGVVYAGGGTQQQQAAGVEDSVDDMFAYLRHEVGDAVQPQTLRRFCEDSRDLIAWLESHGARFEGAPNPPKTSYPRNGVYLYYSGNEAIAGYCDDARPAARGHRTVCAGLSGKRLFAAVDAAVRKGGIAVRSPAAVRRLVMDDAGRVLGAEVWELPAGSAARQRFNTLIRRADKLHNVAPGLADRWRRRAMQIESAAAQKRLIRARQGVALCTGGFIFHRQMLAEHAWKFLPNMRLGSSGCEGSGIRLGQSAGGELGRMDKVSAWRFINPPTAWVGGIVVNAQGQRFCNEASYGARLGVAMCENQDGRAWLILDRAQRRRAWREALLGGLWSFQKIPAMLLMLLAPRARTVAALARRMGVDEAALQDSLATNNAAAAGQADDPLGKRAPQLQPLTQPPFAALDISSTNPMFPCPAITLGGLRVDEESGAVLNAEGQAIAGLYAAGRAAVGIASNGYVSGLSLADCFWSGRRAGRSMARQDAAKARAA